MSKLEKLPYYCKQLINEYALDKVSEYPTVEEFNKACDYDVCEFSTTKSQNAEKYYKGWLKKIKRKSNKMTSAYEHIGKSEINNFFGEIYHEFNLFLCHKYHNKTRDEIEDYEYGYLCVKWDWNENCLNGKKPRSLYNDFHLLEKEEGRTRHHIICDFNLFFIGLTLSKNVWLHVSESRYYFIGELSLQNTKTFIKKLGLDIDDKSYINMFSSKESFQVRAPQFKYPYVELE